MTSAGFPPITMISGNDIIGIKQLQENLRSHSHLKDMGPVKYFLGLEVTHSEHGILLT